MRLRGILLAGAWVICTASCGGPAVDGAKRSLLGISEQQLLIDAQHVLAAEGIEVETIDVENGELTSQWETRARRQLQYVVKISKSPTTDSVAAPASSHTAVDADGGVKDAVDTEPAPVQLKGTQSVTLEVKVQRREKTVKGWSNPVPASAKKAEDLADDIVELSVGRFDHGIQVTSMMPEDEAEEAPPQDMTPTCESTAGCDLGLHCAAGRCVAECSQDLSCPGNEQCDPRGRCIAKPEPCPAPSEETSSGTVDDELPYEMEDEKAKKSATEEDAEKAAKKERRRKRREREARENAEEGKVSDAE